MAEKFNVLDVLTEANRTYKPQQTVPEGFFSDLAAGASDAFLSGAADLPRVLQKITDSLANAAQSEEEFIKRNYQSQDVGYIPEKPKSVNKFQLFRQLADAIEPKDFQDQPSLTYKIGGIFGGLLGAIPKYAPAVAAAAINPVLGAATFGAMDAATAWGKDAPPAEIIKEGAKGTAFGGLLGVGGKLSRWPRIGVVGGGATALEAAAGNTNLEDLGLTGLTMGILSARGRLPHGLEGKLNKLGYSHEVIKKLPIQEARDIAKNNTRFVAPVIEAEAGPPPVGYGDLPGLLSQEGTSQANAVLSSESIYDRLLLARKFSANQIAALPEEHRIALANSPHTPDTVKIDAISGQMTLTGKVPGPGKAKSPEVRAEEQRLADLLARNPELIPESPFKATVEDLAVDPAKDKAALKALVDSAKKFNLGEQVAVEEPVVKAKAPEVTASKEMINQLKFKFGITETDAKRSAILLAEKGIVIPSDATAYFDSIPRFVKADAGGKKFKENVTGRTLYGHIMAQEPGIKAAEAAKAAEQLAKETQKFDERELGVELGQIDNKIAKANAKIVLLDGKLKLEATAVDKKVFNRLEKDRQALQEAIEYWNKAKEDVLLKIEENKPINEAAKLVDIQKELAKTDASLAALGEETAPIVGKKTILRKKATAEQVVKETLQEEKPLEDLNRAALMGDAKILWPGRDADLAGLSDADLQTIKTFQLTPENASLKEGKLFRIEAGDKAIADSLKIPIEDAIKVRAAADPAAREALLLDKAAKWMEVDLATLEQRMLAEKRTPAEIATVKNSMVASYAKYLDDNTAKLQKVVDKLGEVETEATRAFNDILPQDPKTDITLTRLVQKATDLKADIGKAKLAIKLGKMTPAELAPIRVAYQDALKAVETQRLQVKTAAKKAAQSPNATELLITLNKDEIEATIVRKSKSPTTDEFQLLTRIEGTPTIAGRVTIEKTLEGRPMRITFPDALEIPQQEFFKEQLKNAVHGYYEKSGFGTSEPGGKGGVTLRMGIDTDLLAGMAARLKQKTISIYQGFAERKGPGSRISREEIPAVMKDMMDGEKLIDYEKNLALLQAESMTQGRTQLPKEATVPETGKLPPTSPPTTVGAPGGIPKGDIPMVKYTDILGQSSANANPDIRALSDLAILNERRKTYLKEQLVYGDNSRLNAIFKEINARPDAQYLREQISDSFIRNTVPKNPLVLEAKDAIRSLLDTFGDANDLRQREFFIDKYFPLIADMEGTYTKIKGLWANIDNNRPYAKGTNPRGLPERYIEAGESALSNPEFLELKTILKNKKTWGELSNLEKNRIRYNILQFEGIYDQWAFLPSDIMNQTNKSTFNPHLEARKGGELLAYKHDSYEVLKQYLYTMINKESDRIFKLEAMPLLNKYPRADTIRSVRWYMEKQVKQALGSKTIGDKWLSQETERLNNAIGQEVLQPNFPALMAGRLAGQVAKGLIGPDTALRNIMQSIQTLVNEGPGKFMKGLDLYLQHLKGKGDPEVAKWFKILLGGEEYYEGEPIRSTLKARWVRGEGAPGKALAFYDWIGDMAMSPMRATEHFNKFLAFQTALSEAGERGWSFEKGVRLGLLKSTTLMPDLLIPDAYFNAFKSVIQSQYGYSKVMRNPLTRGPLAKISTIFWSYPANTVQFIARGLTDGIKSGDINKTARFALYTGFQLSIATAMAQLGVDVGAIFGQGLLPVEPLSVPWKVMKNSYVATFGKTAGDRSSATDDLLNSFGAVFVPQFRYGSKVVKAAVDLERGYKAAGSKQLEVMEMSPIVAIMDLTGFPMTGTKATWDLYSQMRDQAYEYGEAKQKLVLRGIKALDKGKMDEIQKVFLEAQDKKVVLTYSELAKYYRMGKTKTYLQSQLDKLPKHLRPAMQTKITELEQELMPHRFGKGTGEVADRSMWSSSARANEEE